MYETVIVIYPSKKFLHFVKCKISLLWLQRPAAKQLNVVHAHFFQACMNSILPGMTCHPQYTKYPSHLILLDLITQIILGVYFNWQLLLVASCHFTCITPLMDRVVPMLHTAACVGSVWVALSCCKCLSNCERMYACVERVFGGNNKQGIVVSSSATYESMQVLLFERCEKNVVSSFSPAVLHCAVDNVFVRCNTCLWAKRNNSRCIL
jgi:hypothetical protein